MGIGGRHAAAAAVLLCLGYGQAEAQQPPATGEATEPDVAEPEVASAPTTGPTKDTRSSVPIRVSYTAHDECPDANAFWARVPERTPDACETFDAGATLARSSGRAG